METRPTRVRHIGLDADDTLWHNMPIFNSAQQQFQRLLSKYHSEDWIEQRLNQVEKRNLSIFGYGIKGFALSMIETAIELTEGRIQGDEIQKILIYAKQMMESQIDLLPGVREAVRSLASQYPLVLITKGDLFDQESKIARSGLAEYFARVEIVTEKDPSTYRQILERHSIDPRGFLMVGNSLRSDVLPVLEIGSMAVHVPYPDDWVHELVEDRVKEEANYVELPDLLSLLSWLD